MSTDHSATIAATAALLGLQITAEQRPGVLMYFGLAAAMAQKLDGLALTPADESGQVFVPVSPDVPA